MSAKPYNGFPSWAAWNVSLWINNDERLYRMAVDLVKHHGEAKAARHLAANLDGEKTPDGARYSLRSIRLALEGMA